MEGDVVSVSYLNEPADLKAAARLAAHVVPTMVRFRRGAQFVLASLVAFWVMYLLVVVIPRDGDPGAPIAVLAPLGAVTAGTLLWSLDGFWAFQAARHPLARRTIGETTLRVDSEGVAQGIVGSSGTWAWSLIDRVADGDETLLFNVGNQLYAYVPSRVLSDADRATIRRLAAGGPEWRDLRRTPSPPVTTTGGGPTG